MTAVVSTTAFILLACKAISYFFNPFLLSCLFPKCIMLQRDDSACMAVMGSSIAQIKQSSRFIGIQVFKAVEIGFNAKLILHMPFPAPGNLLRPDGVFIWP